MLTMTLKKLNKEIPVSQLGPDWDGVKVLVTETGFDALKRDADPYGFNLGTHVGDSLTHVQARRSLVEKEMGAPVVWLNQVHGCEVFEARLASDAMSSGTTPPVADASISVSCNLALAIMTADCLPVVFVAFSNSGKALGVAAAHAGWRGLHAGVLLASAKALSQACEVPLMQIKAWMGPAIGPHSFEVGAEVFNAFVQQNPNTIECFKPGDKSGKYLADLYALARHALRELGNSNIEGGGWDTVTDPRWFSHRRGQQQGVQSGRFATLIRLLPEHGA
ncbi:peptidoglycan editing factor PgeF [Limnobacter sp. P1]|uniref:peptidoglycan editing factor PgeF n=1 Tax=Limnobacter olei TaxID=3031298 RepID=UPI0023B1D757|nr:peptidoglycan editing factor PgeF [Limnobacter sp. P1]